MASAGDEDSEYPRSLMFVSGKSYNYDELGNETGAGHTNYGYEQPPIASVYDTNSYGQPSARYNAGYDQSSNPPERTNHVIVTQPHPPTVTVNPKPSDFMIWSLVTTFCCCLPLGLVALVYSCQSRAAAERFDFDTAREEANTSKVMNIIGLVLGLTITTLLVLYHYEVFD